MPTEGRPDRTVLETGEADAWAAHQRRQIRLGLELTPAERLRWLETTVDEMRSWLGRCRNASSSKPRPE